MTKRIPKLKFTQDKRGLWRWSLIAANGKCLADSGEGYATRAKVERGAYATLVAVQRAWPPFYVWASQRRQSQPAANVVNPRRGELWEIERIKCAPSLEPSASFCGIFVTSGTATM